MSVITINRNSLLNSIIKEGKAVFGTVSDKASSLAPAEPIIKADGDGAIVAGRIESYMLNGAPFIYAKGNGAVASGCVYESEIGSFIYADGNSAYAGGYAYNSSISAIGTASHAEGYAESIKIIYLGTTSYNYYPIMSKGIGAHAEGISTQATKDGAHAEGYHTTASGNYAHAEGSYTTASDLYSHAEGYHTSALNPRTHASGWYTIADLDDQFVCGKFNTSNNENALFVVGSGTGTTNRKDAFTVKSDSITGVVNNINNVIIGEPIGTMTMWMGHRSWPAYNLPVQIDNNGANKIPTGYILAAGGSVRLRFIEKGEILEEAGTNINSHKNNTDYVYIPRYTSDYSHYYDDASYYDKFELVGYRLNEVEWRAIDSEAGKFPSNAKWYQTNCERRDLSESHKKELTRFLNHIILYTKVYVEALTDNRLPQTIYWRPTINSNTTYFYNNTSTCLPHWLESHMLGYTDLTGYTIYPGKLSWYENTIKYVNNGRPGHSLAIDDIIIDLPNMTTRIPLGAGDINYNFGNVSTMMPNGTSYANINNGATGGEDIHNLNDGTGTVYVSDSGSYTIAKEHNNIPPYMAVNFIIKYK